MIVIVSPCCPSLMHACQGMKYNAAPMVRLPSGNDVLHEPSVCGTAVLAWVVLEPFNKYGIQISECPNKSIEPPLQAFFLCADSSLGWGDRWGGGCRCWRLLGRCDKPSVG